MPTKKKTEEITDSIMEAQNETEEQNTAPPAAEEQTEKPKRTRKKKTEITETEEPPVNETVEPQTEEKADEEAAAEPVKPRSRILTVEAKAEVYTEQTRADIIWHEIYNHNTNAYWEEGSEYDMNTSPVCSSPDGKTGYGTPGGACVDCPYNQYESDPNGGKGKACKNMRSLYILESGKPMPINLLLSPTSLKAYSNFVQSAFLMRNRPIWGSLIHIELRKETNGPNNYAVAVFKLLGDFTGEKLAEIKRYAIEARAGIKEMLEQRAINTEERNEPIDSFTEIDDGNENDGDSFSVA